MVEEDVAGLQVVVHDAALLAVEVLEAAAPQPREEEEEEEAGG